MTTTTTAPHSSEGPTGALPEGHAETIRALLRFAAAMTVFALLSGILFQESSKKLDFAEAPNGLRWEATVGLALVHGHAFLIGVLLPVAAAGMLRLAAGVGGRPLGPKPLAWLRRAYLPGAASAIALMLYKGYHVLLAVRFAEGGSVDLDAVHDRLFGGAIWVRHVVYGASHVAMGVGLGVFAIAVWRSLGRRAREAVQSARPGVR